MTHTIQTTGEILSSNGLYGSFSSAQEASDWMKERQNWRDCKDDRWMYHSGSEVITATVVPLEQGDMSESIHSLPGY